jgi:hypothetical protein
MMTDDVLYGIPFRDSNGTLWMIDYRDIGLAMERDPGGRTMPGDDPNELLLTADDCVWLWSQNISW